MGYLEVPDEKYWQHADDEVLEGTDDGTGDDDGTLVIAVDYVGSSPRNVVDVEEASHWCARKDNQECEQDAVYTAEDDHGPCAVYECVGERSGDPSVEAENGDLDKGSCYQIAELDSECSLRNQRVL